LLTFPEAKIWRKEKFRAAYLNYFPLAIAIDLLTQGNALKRINARLATSINDLDSCETTRKGHGSGRSPVRAFVQIVIPKITPTKTPFKPANRNKNFRSNGKIGTVFYNLRNNNPEFSLWSEIIAAKNFCLPWQKRIFDPKL
jgi:hypothetical protein